jgi:hypothetical protein
MMSLSLHLCIYLSLYLIDYVFDLQTTSIKLRTPTWELLLVVYLHQNKCGVMY